MNPNNLYHNEYIAHLEKVVLRLKYLIVFLAVMIVVFSAISIVLSSTESYQWLLFLNIPLDILSIFVIMILVQVHLPTYKWEIQMAQRSKKSERHNVKGIVIAVMPSVFFEDQRMISIVVQTNERDWELFVRPWLYHPSLCQGARVSIDFVSKVIVAFEAGEKL